MKVSADKIARATGGINGDFLDWVPRSASYFNDFSTDLSELFINSPYLPRIGQYIKESNKITYYSPMLNGITFGISYTPDANNIGTTYFENNTFSQSGYRNVFEGGFVYSTPLSEDIRLSLSGTAQIGSAKSFAYQRNKGRWQILDVNNLVAWEGGIECEYKGVAVVGSYGDWGKSGTLKDKKLISGMLKQGRFWTVGAAYTYGKLGVSITYMLSHRAGGVIYDKNTQALVGR